ncbi:MAG: sensor histidine kinase, partial [Lachnospiraceae bacterium]|nr:sensor histidine kinase [Lachnospiraceae bacterium]
TIRSFSGVVAVDAIVSEWYQKAVDNRITWEWEGRLSEKTTIEVYDLCVLFSNLLSNAVEAVLKVEEEKGRIIKVQIGCMQEQIVIRVMNTCTEEAKENVNLKTTKLDSMNHGFGMKNIMSIVEKGKGQIDRKFEEGFFVVEIVL